MRKQIFISYAHDDERWRDRLLKVLAPLARLDEIDVWDDRRIAPGEHWAARIDEQIDRSNVAALLVSTAFLSSQFIADVELPRIVDAAENGRLTLVWIPVSASMWDSTALARFQGAIDPSKPLDRMSRARAEEALVSVARTIAAGRALTDVARAMGVVDAAYDELSGQAEPHRVLARHTGEQIDFVERGSQLSVETITAEDLIRLPSDDYRLVEAFESGMREEYERWTLLRPRRATLTTRERAQYEASGRTMCTELRNLLDFLEYELHKNLQDHYHGIRFACERLITDDV